MPTVTFWGTRGSLPSSLNAQQVRKKVISAISEARSHVSMLTSEKAIGDFVDSHLPFSVWGTYGCNTSCLELSHNRPSEHLIIDAGSGIRDLGHQLMKKGSGGPDQTFHLLMTHLHWDHIQGFPFFTPAYIKGNKVIIYTYHEEALHIFRQQMKAPWFPVPFEALQAEIELVILKRGEPFNLCGYDIRSIQQDHPGVSYGYRFEKEGRVFVHSTDSEHKQGMVQKDDYPFVEFFKDADLLVFDAQYNLAESLFTKANWGHSSNVMGVELASRAGVKHLCLFHNEPTADDATLDEFLKNTRMFRDVYARANKDTGNRMPEKISIAYDGLAVDF